MNRPRGKGSRDLPPGLYAEKRGKVAYYIYRHPLTGKRHGMGRDRTQAILAAGQLNTMLSRESSLVDGVLGRTNLFSAWLDKYIEVRVSEAKMADKTRKQLKYDTARMKDGLGVIPIGDLSVYHCSEFLDGWVSQGKRRMAARMRSQLVKCLDYAMGHGLIDTNPAAKTLPVTATVTRKRLTLEQFNAIYALAPKPIKNAMMLGLITLQRREDIAAMRFRDITGGHLYVRQIKTASAKKARRQDSHNKAAHLMIAITPQLKRVVSACRDTGVVSTYLVHHIHGRKSAGATHREVKPGMPLQPDNITRGFATARNRSKLFEGLEPHERPTFHEIRALGAHLYREQGIDPQALLGHTDARMTAHYLDGHGVDWTIVTANLEV